MPRVFKVGDKVRCIYGVFDNPDDFVGAGWIPEEMDGFEGTVSAIDTGSGGEPMPYVHDGTGRGLYFDPSWLEHIETILFKETR